MNTLIAGFASGMFMAQLFITVGCLTAFFALKDPTPSAVVMFSRFSPAIFVMSVVVFSYPLWCIIGLILAFLFRVLQNAVPGPGLGSPNVVYTVGVSVALLMLALPVLVLAKRLWKGITCITLLGIATFGWMLPLLAS